MWDSSSKNGRAKIYVAGPLFSQAEREFNCRLKQLLQQFFHVYLPQEDGGLLVDMVSNGIPHNIAARKVFAADIAALEECDLFLIILDGRAVDEGAAFELGFASAKRKPCYGLRTDPRQLLPLGNNPMIEGPIKEMFYSTDSLLRWARKCPVRGNLLPRDTESGHVKKGTSISS